eukprot:m.97452 g.97452  ORF g.97452 m.97452 type:complete len:344 (-) comp13595_c0_seq6:3218-4249(-)
MGSNPFYRFLFLGILILPETTNPAQRGFRCVEWAGYDRHGYFETDVRDGTAISSLTTQLSKPPMRWPRKHILCDLVYVKIPKCASSTIRGVVKHYGQVRGLSGTNLDIEKNCSRLQCSVHAAHGFLNAGFSRCLQSKKKFVFAFVREPQTRFISHIKQKLKAFNATIDVESRKLCVKNAQKNKISMTHLPIDTNLMARYLHTPSSENPIDFIGTVERFHESIVALAVLTATDVKYFLYGNPIKQALRSPSRHISEFDFYRLMNYTATYEFKAKNSLDIALYDWVNESLSKTIESLEPEFSIQLQRYYTLTKRYRQKLEKVCRKHDDVCKSLGWDDRIKSFIDL